MAERPRLVWMVLQEVLVMAAVGDGNRTARGSRHGARLENSCSR
jgi:hypothetical protein